MPESLIEQLGGWELTLWTIAVGVLAAVPCAVLGCYLVLRRMSLLGDAISHAVLPGIALAFVLTGRVSGVPLLLGAMLLGVATAFLTDWLHHRGNVPEDASLGVVFTALFAVGVIVITRAAANVDLDPGCVLYGQIDLAFIDSVEWGPLEFPRAVITMGLALVLVTLFVALFWKELLITSFDAPLATAMGLSAGLVHYLLMAMVAGMTVAAFEAVGSILVVAMLIVPAAIGQLWADRLSSMLAWAVASAVASAVLGYLGAAFWNTSVAGMMASVAGGLLAASVACSPRHGLLARQWRRWRLGQRIAREDVLATLFRDEEARARGEATALPTLAAVSLRAPGWGGRWALASLRRRGEVMAHEGRLALTDAGRQTARSIVRAHRLWERYLETHFDLPLDHLHEPAERMEHFLSEQLQAELADGLDHEAVDPHGRIIPPV